MEFEIGQSIKTLREYLGITQKELADGICDQGMISRIEKGNVIPSAYLLYQIAERFGVNINYFIDSSVTKRHEYVQEVFEQLRRFVREKDYESAAEMVRHEKKNPLFATKDSRQFLLWHEGICAYYQDGDLERSISSMEEALEETGTTGKSYSEREFSILNSMAAIYAEHGDNEEAIELYNRLVTQMKRHLYFTDNKVKLRVYYNYAKLLTRERQYERALEMCDLGIETCIRHQLLYLFGNLNYQKGDVLDQLGRHEEAISWMGKAVTAFELLHNEKFAEIVRGEILKVEERKQEQ
ncbi:helix-turn-helix domain-containing protein [Bacillus marinisedimentorum]|uniref:helix-turn-helix domain-containing protein n=1 Tax=Bacillus marinisedimentorum TaxID=1821260 RepID=UPI0008728FB6|nr:tetratricopeptide repeat protein [Bacillus marinisedimentorum]